jgi:hypothetical protein
MLVTGPRSLKVLALDSGQANGQNSIGPVQGAPLEDALFTEYDTGEREVYDLTVDPYQLDTIVDQVPEPILGEYSQRLAGLASCIAAERRSLEDKRLPSFHAG